MTFTNPAALAPLGVRLHPVQLYEAGLDVVLLGVLWATRRQPAFEAGLSLLQAVSLAMLRTAFAAGAVLSARRALAGRRPAA